MIQPKMNSLESIAIIMILACSLIGHILADCCKREIEYEFLGYATYEPCEGKDGGNYTYIYQFTRDSKCSPDSAQLVPNPVLLSCSSNSKQTNVNQLKVLATQYVPNGGKWKRINIKQEIISLFLALANDDTLFVAISGPLEGKYLYRREIAQVPEYLKVCSSVLGYGYISSKSSVLLISEKLDLNVLISPTGGFELFKKGCTTVCRGSSIAVGPSQIIQKRD